MKKIWNIISTLFVWLFVLLAVCMMIFTIISVTTFDRNDRAVFGYKAFIVQSDSMSATDFDAGDLIIVKEVDPATLKEDDIISYVSEHEMSKGMTVTHKIRALTVNEDGRPAFITYGTTTNTDDSLPVDYAHVQGKYIFNLPGVGSFFAFLKTVPGYLCCILLPFLLLIIVQAVSVVRNFRQYRKSQLDEIKSHENALVAEREEAKRMMEEVQRMKAEMEEKMKAQMEEQPKEPLKKQIKEEIKEQIKEEIKDEIREENIEDILREILGDRYGESL